jgi:hypothetical protein
LSPLTKTFVVLLVILSMLLSAATIVFVNANVARNTELQSAKERLAAAEQRNAQLGNESAAAQRILEDNLQNQAQQNEQLKQQINNINAQLVDRATQLGQAQSQIAMMSADVTRLTEGLQASERTKAALHEQNNQLRQTNDARLTENTQLNQRVNELTSTLEQTEAARRNLAEQLAEARNRAEQMGAQLKGVGLSTEQLAAAGTRVAPQVSGQVREVRPIAGIPYATISIGSNDGVRRGMEFRVVNPQTGDFLGMLTVESVELNESTGRLSGPKVAQIRQGNEVRSQSGA